MNLPVEVTIQPPPRTLPNGQILESGPITLSSVRVTLIDSAWGRVCAARLANFPLPVTLWQADDYDAAGDYTQAEAEARILEVLGPDIKAGLERLFG